jgi:hypothetical protein
LRESGRLTVRLPLLKSLGSFAFFWEGGGRGLRRRRRRVRRRKWVEAAAETKGEEEEKEEKEEKEEEEKEGKGTHPRGGGGGGGLPYLLGQRVQRPGEGGAHGCGVHDELRHVSRPLVDVVRVGGRQGHQHVDGGVHLGQTLGLWRRRRRRRRRRRKRRRRRTRRTRKRRKKTRRGVKFIQAAAAEVEHEGC